MHSDEFLNLINSETNKSGIFISENIIFLFSLFHNKGFL